MAGPAPVIRLVASALLALTLAGCSPAAELLVFTGPRCRACEQFKADLDADPSLADPYPVRLLSASSPEAKAHAVKSVPTFVLVDGEATVTRHVGYRGPRQLRAWLQRAGR